MARVVGIGHQDFETIISRNIFYIDKTKFIKEWWENEDEVTLITRPRRFGKTLNMSMLEQFFPWTMRTEETYFRGLPSGRKNPLTEITSTGNCREHTLSLAFLLPM